MVDQALEYKSLLNKIHVMIDNVSKYSPEFNT